MLQVPTTQLAKMSVDPKFVELTALTVPVWYIIIKYVQVLTDSQP